ncbi:MAG: LPS-assembly protein LptD [Deltaproteobacteria bacterium]
MFLSFALLALAQVSPAPEPRPLDPIQLDADRFTDDGAHGVAHADGHVVIRTGGLLLRAPSATEELHRRTFAIDGPLFAVDGGNVIVAQRALLEPDGRLTLIGVELAQKEQWDPAALAAAATPEAALSLGKNLLVVFADRIVRTGPAHYLIEGLTLTPCEAPRGCSAAWSLSAPHADVLGGTRALLDWPVLHVDGVPVLPLPALYVPLAHRQTGFLLPHFTWQAQNGLIVDEPFFLTLGPSFDLTLSPGYVFGQSERGLGAGGVQGPRAGVELRYAPSVNTAGRLFVSVLDDFHHDLGEVRGARGSLHDWHVQDLSDRDGDRLDVSLVSDATLTGQLTTDILYASIPGTRSAATAFHRGDDWLASLGAVVLQDFQGAFSPENVHELLFGPGSPRTLATLPRLDWNLLDERLGVSPLFVSADASYAHFAALGGPYDLITLGPPVPAPSPAGAVAAPALPGRAPVDRVDLRPELELPLAGRLAAVDLSAAWRQDAWLFEAPPVAPGLGAPLSTSGERSYPILDARASTRLERSIGDGWLHAISPEVEVRALPWLEQSGTLPPLLMSPPSAAPFGGLVLDHATGLPVASAIPLPYDELDFAPGIGAPPQASPILGASALPTSLWQGKLDLSQRLDGPAGHARLDLGEYFDLGGPESAFGFGSAAVGRWHGDGYALYSSKPLPCQGCTTADARLRRLSEAGADLGVNDARGDSLGASFVRTIAAGSPRLSAPVDALFAPALAPNDPRWALPDVSQLSANGSVQVVPAVAVHGGLVYLLPAEAPVQLLFGAGYRSPQGCWALDGNLVVQPIVPGGPLGIAAFFVTFDLGPLGGGGTL